MPKIINISTLRQGVSQVVLLDYDTFEAMQSRLRELEEEHLLRVVAEGRDEQRRGKTRRVNSLADLR
jgi:PHD/YefM family antitoxin component YafN of YafNO toxin-antitoxin module